MNWLDRIRHALRPGDPEPPRPRRNALVLSGGGARASYQAGVLRYVAEAFPWARFPIITGVSAGSINAARLVANELDFGQSVAHLVDCWGSIHTEDVFDAPSGLDLFWRTFRGRQEDNTDEFVPRYGLVDTQPLRNYLVRILGAEADGSLPGIEHNLASGRLHAIAFLATNYGTAQTVSWVQGAAIEGWSRPNRVGRQAVLTVDHIMASTSLPFLFPAIRLDDAYYGDGGIRLSEPLSPAIHLGADRLLAVSTRYDRSQREADRPVISGYPPAAQVFSVLLNAVFLDRLDQDAATLERYNAMLSRLHARDWGAMRPLRMLLIRPSRDLGQLSSKYEPDLSGILKWFARGLGSSETKSPDWLSMILFDPRYTQELMDIGYHDGAARRDDIARFLDE